MPFFLLCGSTNLQNSRYHNVKLVDIEDPQFWSELCYLVLSAQSRRTEPHLVRKKNEN